MSAGRCAVCDRSLRSLSAIAAGEIARRSAPNSAALGQRNSPGTAHRKNFVPVTASPTDAHPSAHTQPRTHPIPRKKNQATRMHDPSECRCLHQSTKPVADKRPARRYRTVNRLSPGTPAVSGTSISASSISETWTQHLQTERSCSFSGSSSESSSSESSSSESSRSSMSTPSRSPPCNTSLPRSSSSSSSSS